MCPRKPSLYSLNLPLPFQFSVGVHEATFRVLNCETGSSSINFYLGVVPSSKVTLRGPGYRLGYFYQNNGWMHTEGAIANVRDCKYTSGDAITVRLDLNSNTVSFQKNKTAVGEPQGIPANTSYHFAFDANYDTYAVAIEDVQKL